MQDMDLTLERYLLDIFAELSKDGKIKEDNFNKWAQEYVKENIDKNDRLKALVLENVLNKPIDLENDAKIIALLEKKFEKISFELQSKGIYLSFEDFKKQSLTELMNNPSILASAGVDFSSGNIQIEINIPASIDNIYSKIEEDVIKASVEKNINQQQPEENNAENKEAMINFVENKEVVINNVVEKVDDIKESIYQEKRNKKEIANKGLAKVEKDVGQYTKTTQKIKENHSKDLIKVLLIIREPRADATKEVLEAYLAEKEAVINDIKDKMIIAKESSKYHPNTIAKRLAAEFIETTSLGKSKDIDKLVNDINNPILAKSFYEIVGQHKQKTEKAKTQTMIKHNPHEVFDKSPNDIGILTETINANKEMYKDDPLELFFKIKPPKEPANKEAKELFENAQKEFAKLVLDKMSNSKEGDGYSNEEIAKRLADYYKRANKPHKKQKINDVVLTLCNKEVKKAFEKSINTEEAEIVKEIEIAKDVVETPKKMSSYQRSMAKLKDKYKDDPIEIFFNYKEPNEAASIEDKEQFELDKKEIIEAVLAKNETAQEGEKYYSGNIGRRLATYYSRTNKPNKAQKVLAKAQDLNSEEIMSMFNSSLEEIEKHQAANNQTKDRIAQVKERISPEQREDKPMTKAVVKDTNLSLSRATKEM